MLGRFAWESYRKALERFNLWFTKIVWFRLARRRTNCEARGFSSRMFPGEPVQVQADPTYLPLPINPLMFAHWHIHCRGCTDPHRLLREADRVSSTMAIGTGQLHRLMGLRKLVPVLQTSPHNSRMFTMRQPPPSLNFSATRQPFHVLPETNTRKITNAHIPSYCLHCCLKTTIPLTLNPMNRASIKLRIQAGGWRKHSRMS